jgi:hypothetical protein
LHIEGVCVSIKDQCLCCRFTDSALSQLQLPVLVRFSSYAIMLESMLKYRHALVSAVLSEDFLVASSKAFKRRKNTGCAPPSEQVHEVLLAAEEELEQDGEQSFQRTTPDELCTPWARVYQAVLSEDFWLSAEVCTS